MKRNFIAAAILSLASAVAFAAPGNGNNSASQGAISGQAQVGGEYTTGTVNGSVSANSNISGDAISATRVNGNGFSSQTTTSVGMGSATGSIAVSPTSVTAATSQTGYSNVVSQGVTKGDAPSVDSQGLIVNGTTGLASVQNTAGAGVSQTFVGKSGQGAIEGSAAYEGTGSFAGL